MNLTEAFFSNPFDSVRITPVRLAAFAQDALTKLGTETGEPFPALVASLTPPLVQLHAEVGSLDTSLQRQKSKTGATDQFIINLGEAVRAAEPSIAAALGGYESTGYKQFFPAGTREYSKTSKKNVPVLTTRLVNMCTEFSAQLPAPLVAQLSGFALQWKALDEAQSTSRKDTREDRTDRSAARQAVERQLLKAIHTVAALYPGDMEKGKEFFDFGLLRASRYASLQKKADPAITPQ
ncbi:MAG: hypothetical protein JWP69_2416 [Flaviaesturariibacter sp.]|nr:hypothetical protein [Flaviaesturariibacter sp.]